MAFRQLQMLLLTSSRAIAWRVRRASSSSSLASSCRLQHSHLQQHSHLLHSNLRQQPSHRHLWTTPVASAASAAHSQYAVDPKNHPDIDEDAVAVEQAGRSCEELGDLVRKHVAAGKYNRAWSALQAHLKAAGGGLDEDGADAAVQWRDVAWPATKAVTTATTTTVTTATTTTVLHVHELLSFIDFLHRRMPRDHEYRRRVRIVAQFIRDRHPGFKRRGDVASAASVDANANASADAIASSNTATTLDTVLDNPPSSLISTTDYDALIRTVARAQHLELAKELLREAEAGGERVSSRTYAALIEQLIRERRQQEAIELFRRLKDEDVRRQRARHVALSVDERDNELTSSSSSVVATSSSNTDTDDNIVTGALYSAFIAGFARIDDGRYALLFAKAKQQAHFPLTDADRRHMVFAHFNDGQPHAIKRLEAFLEPAGTLEFPLTEELCTTVMWCWARRGEVDRTRAWYRRANASFTEPGTVHLPMMYALVQADRMDEAMALYEELKREELKKQENIAMASSSSSMPSTSTSSTSTSLALTSPSSTTTSRFCKRLYSILMHGHIRQSDVNSALAVFNDMVKMGVEPDAYHYAILMNGYVKEKDMAMAETVMRLMREKSSVGSRLAVSSTARTTMISGLMRTRNSRRAFAEFDALRASGLPLSDNPTSAHLSTIMLFGAAWNGHLDRFAELLQVVKDTALPMDGYLGNALIYAHGAAGDLDKAKEVFDRMVDKMDRENGISDVASDGPGDSAEEAMMLHGIARGEPVHTYNSMMAAYLHCRQPAGAYELLKMMREREVAPSVGTYTILMQLSAHDDSNDGWQRAKRFFNVLAHDPNIPRIPGHAITTLFSAFAANDLPSALYREVLDTLDHVRNAQAKEASVPANAWTVYVKALLQAGQPADASAAFTGALQSGVVFRPDTVATVLQAYEDHGHYEELRKMREVLDTFFSEYNPELHGGATRKGVGALATTLLQGDGSAEGVADGSDEGRDVDEDDEIAQSVRQARAKHAMRKVLSVPTAFGAALSEEKEVPGRSGGSI